MVSIIFGLTSLTNPFCSSASWSFSVRFWVRARLIVALSDWTSSNMRRRSSASWVWLSTCRSKSPRRDSCSAHRRLNCSLSRSWEKYYRGWLHRLQWKKKWQFKHALKKMLICDALECYGHITCVILHKLIDSFIGIFDEKQTLTCAWYCAVRASFSCCKLLRASCRATSCSDGPEDSGSAHSWVSFSAASNAKVETVMPIIKVIIWPHRKHLPKAAMPPAIPIMLQLIDFPN